MSFFVAACAFVPASPALSSASPMQKSAQARVEASKASQSSLFRADLPLHDYVPPSANELLREAGFKASKTAEGDLLELEHFLTGTLDSNVRRDIVKRCAQNRAQKGFRFSSSADLVCIPPAIEERYYRDVIGVTAAKEETSIASRIETAEQFNTLANKDFQESVRALKAASLEESQRHKKLFIEKSTDCRFRNAGAAIIAQAESWLPTRDGHQLIEEVYQKNIRCLRPSEDGFERTHLRVGLLRLSRNDFAGATAALQHAVLAAEPKEEQRTLFWLGVLAQTSSMPESNDYWIALMRRYPLEIHAILAAHSIGKDPLANLMGQDSIIVKRRSASDNGEFNAVALLCEILKARNSKEALRAWVQQAIRQYVPSDPQETLFLAYHANRGDLFLESIGLLSRYLKSMGAGNVNQDFLDLFFPRPFADVILASSGTVDPVLIFSLIRQESAFNPLARSQADARGLMQVVPSTAILFEKVTPQQLYETPTNVRIGVRLLEDLMKRFSGKAELVLSAYNAGPGHIPKWQNRTPVSQELLFSDLIPFKETRGYVANILRNAYWYGRLLTLTKDTTAQKTIEKSDAAQWKSNVVHNLLTNVWHGNVSSVEARRQVGELFRLQGSSPFVGSSKSTEFVQEFPNLDGGQTAIP